MSEPLSKLTEFSQKKDYNSLVGRHSELEDDIEKLREELEETLGSESDLDADQIERIRETYVDVVQADLQTLLNESYELDGFSTAVQDIQEDLEEVLHNPKAEAIVDEIDEWIISTGLEPLSGDEKRGLREVIISDIETSDTAVTRAKSAHDAMRGDLGPLQEQVDESLRAELVATDAPSDLVEIRDSLQQLQAEWYGDWELSYELDIGKKLNEEIWTVLIDEIQDDLEDDQSLNKIAVLVSTRSDAIEKALSNIDDAWADIEDQYLQISDDVSYDESKLLTLLDDVRPENPSLSDYPSAIKTVLEGLETLDEILDEDFDDFQSHRDPAIEDLETALTECRTAIEEASEIQREILELNSVQEIEDMENKFEGFLDDADEARKKLQNQLSEKVKTVRRLTEKFDIETEQSTVELFTATVGQNSVDRLLELSETAAEILEKVRKQARLELPEKQAQLLEDILTLSTTTENLNLEKIDSELGDSYENDLIETLIGLQEHDLLEVRILAN
jgi:hypothetical protein